MPVEFIAEIGLNHNGDLNRAKELIEQSALAGFDAVKFQFQQIDKMFRPEVLAKRPDIRDRRKYDFSLAWLPVLKNICRENQVKFYISCYRAEQVPLVTNYVDGLKISSYDLLNRSLLEAVSYTNLLVFVSTGMAEMREVISAIMALDGNVLALFHCVSQYPTQIEQADLWRMIALSVFDLPVGYSDHTANFGVVQRAVNRYSARFIELHIDLDDHQGAEFAGGHCWTVTSTAMLIGSVRDGEQADGTEGLGRTDNTERDWRADEDGLRPMKGVTI